jgi:carbamoyl-phosphate synthase large subunit
MGYRILATRGTAKTLRAAGIACEVTKRVGEGHPNVHDVLSAGGISFIINTPHGHDSHGDGALLRSEAASRGITNVTTLSGATALLQSLAVLRSGRLLVCALQDLAQQSSGRD